MSREVVDPQLPVPAVRVVEAVVLEAHAVGDHATSCVLREIGLQDPVPLGVRQSNGQRGKPDNGGRGHDLPGLKAWGSARRVVLRQAAGDLCARAPATPVAIGTAVTAPTGTSRGII